MCIRDSAKGPTRFSNCNNHEWLGLRKATVDPGATMVGTLSLLFTTIDRGPGQNAFARLLALGDKSLARDQASEKFPTRMGIALFKARDLASYILLTADVFVKRAPIP